MMQNFERKPVVLVTGSSGLIGRAVTRRLSKKYFVVGLDVKAPANNGGSNHINMDVSNSRSVRHALATVRRQYGENIASVIHLAAYYSFSGEDDPKYRKITVDGTKRILNELKKFKTEQFIFSSTMLIHRPQPPGLFVNEGTPIRGAWPYPLSKIQAENVISTDHAEIPTVSLRIAGVYTDKCQSIPLANHIMRIYEMQLTSHFFPGDPNSGQAFLHLDDLTEAMLRSVDLRRKLPNETAILLGEPETLTYGDLQHKIGMLIHGEEWKYLKIPPGLAKAGAKIQEGLPMGREPFIKSWMIEFSDENYELDISKAKMLLNWTPKHRLADTLPSMITELKISPEDWYRQNKLELPGTLSWRLAGPEKHDYPRWLGFLNLMAAVWLVLNTFTFDVANSGMVLSSIASSLMVAFVSVICFFPKYSFLRWINALIGIWVMFSPLVFWAGDAAYTSCIFLGTVIVIASAYTNSPTRRTETSWDTPDGWSYNPSSWRQRSPIIVLGLIGFFSSRYLAAYQMGYIENVWDPFFGHGTELILNSTVSRWFPISDAGLGAFSYLLDVLFAFVGDRRRWRTMPWVVLVFGLLIIPPGVTSITLVILQPLAVGAWCSVCLFVALIMLLMVPPALDEVIASFQLIRRMRKEGVPLLEILRKGDQNVPWDMKPKRKTSHLVEIFPSHTVPLVTLRLIASTLIGVWLLFQPEVMSLTGALSTHTYIIGSLVVSFSVIAFSEVARPGRMVNIFLAIWFLIVTWIFARGMPWVTGLNLAAGILLIVLNFHAGRLQQHFGSYDRIARWTPFFR